VRVPVISNHTLAATTAIDRAVALIEVALSVGVLQKSAWHILLHGMSVAQGIEKNRDALLASPEWRGSVRIARVPPPHLAYRRSYRGRGVIESWEPADPATRET
jgi:hypothetical protein